LGDEVDIQRTLRTCGSRAQLFQVSNPCWKFFADIDARDQIGNDKVLPVVLNVLNIPKGVVGLRLLICLS
jgi:hypothetical protein